MSKKLIDNIKELSHSIKENSSRVQAELYSGNSKPTNQAIVTSAAKYREALERLAKE